MDILFVTTHRRYKLETNQIKGNTIGNTHHCWYVRDTNSLRVFVGLNTFLPLTIVIQIDILFILLITIYVYIYTHIHQKLPIVIAKL